MRFEGKEILNAPLDVVWNFVTDPHKVEACIPGLKSLEVIKDGKLFNAEVEIGLGSMKGGFSANVEWAELKKPIYAKMVAHGTAPGSAADVSSEMKLSEVENGVELSWNADISIVGTIASLAARMMGSVTKKITGQFFKCLKSKIEEDINA